MKILVGVNTLSSLGQMPYSNHCQMWSHAVRAFPPPHEFAFLAPPRMSIDRMRNLAAKIAMENELDYIIFLDDDVCVPLNAVKDLLHAIHSSNYDVLGAHTVIRGYPYHSMVFKYEDGKMVAFDDSQKKSRDQFGIVDCAAIGFSFCALRVSTLQKMEGPYFITGLKHTEDVYYCVKLAQSVADAKIGVLPDMETIHLGDPRMYSPSNRELYKILDELENPGIGVTVPSTDRGKEYLEKCLIALNA